MDSRLSDRLLFLLSAGAGAIDAVLLLKLHVFPANMTGNTVVLAVSIAERNMAHFVPALLALLGFALGALIGGRFMRHEERTWSREVNRLLLSGVVLILLAGFPGWIGLEEHIWIAAPLCAAAMGLQAVAALQVGVAGVSTTAVTSSLCTALARFSGPSPGQGVLPMASWGAYFGGALVAALLLPVANWHTLWISAAALFAPVVVSRCKGFGTSQ